jgi:HAD superfamily hydrolase (TIGR01484 family)
VKPVYLFDVDGTLTAPLAQVDEEFAAVFLEWVEKYAPIVYLVSGSDLKKIQRQLLDTIVDSCAGVFCCSGNQFWQDGAIVSQQKFRAPSGLLKDLKIYLEQGAQYHIRTGNHIERRPGMINFSVVGRKANTAQRNAYARWDKGAREREDIVEYVTQLYPQLDVVIGGSISVDIYPKGNDKSQVVPIVRQLHGDDTPIIFVGDRNMPGGNDWTLAQALEGDPHSHWFQVYSYQETRALIEHSELFIDEGGI